MNFKKWVKSIQTAGYNGARTVYSFTIHSTNKEIYLIEGHSLHDIVVIKGKIRIVFSEQID